ncbi:amylo-alpha-1,6-glucosidase [Methanocella paludicola]|nr:amylo-alpha-1,6-glucosidase [Methanocella paludicola]
MEKLGAGHTRSINIINARVIRENDLSLVTLPNGDIPMKDNFGYGLYYHDCRFLSGYTLTINGKYLTEILIGAQSGFDSIVILTNPDMEDNNGNYINKETLSIGRDIAIPGCVVETITIRNFNMAKVALDLTLNFKSDFNDIFTIRGLTEGVDGKILPIRYDAGDHTLYIPYMGKDGHFRTTKIEFDPPPSKVEKGSCTFSVRLDPRGVQKIMLAIFAQDLPPGKPAVEPRMLGTKETLEGIEKSYHVPYRRHFDFLTDNNLFNKIILRSLSDLRMLYMSLDGSKFHSAGVPWYDALFGRDCILAAIQIMPYHSGSAPGTIKLLAGYQGRAYDDWRDEEPGKILHELRLGEKANLNKIPQTPYYGTVDATPLFLILLAEYVDWTGNLKLLEKIMPNIDAAIAWIDRYSRRDGSEFTSYLPRSARGLSNQGWKDSWDAVMHSDGTLAKPPVALAEVQGYVYMAKKRLAMLYDRMGRGGDGEKLRKDAERLKRAFNDRFWMDDKKFFAMALDDLGVCNVISSNPGHCLWSGIVDEKYAKFLADRLFEPDMYSGWGIRTLSSNELRYNPLGYHIGTVWPHDNSIIAMGLHKYGFYDRLSDLFTGMYDAASVFPLYRLPELFSGFERGKYNIPVKYPVACSPQAWSAGTIPYMLIAALGLTPDALNKRLTLVKPHLPPWLNNIKITDLRVGSASVNMEFRREESGTLVNVVKKYGDLDVFIEY